MSENTERLDAIEKQLGTITPGPWSYGGRGLVETVPKFDLHRYDIMPEIIAKSELRDSDAEFIANAPTDITYLLTLARKQAAALEAVEEWMRTLDVVEEFDPTIPGHLNCSAAGLASVVRASVRTALEATK